MWATRARRSAAATGPRVNRKRLPGLLSAGVPAAAGAAVGGAFSPEHLIDAVGPDREIEIVAVGEGVAVRVLVRRAAREVRHADVGAEGAAAVGRSTVPCVPTGLALLPIVLPDDPEVIRGGRMRCDRG